MIQIDRRRGNKQAFHTNSDPTEQENNALPSQLRSLLVTLESSQLRLYATPCTWESYFQGLAVFGFIGECKVSSADAPTYRRKSLRFMHKWVFNAICRCSCRRHLHNAPMLIGGVYPHTTYAVCIAYVHATCTKVMARTPADRYDILMRGSLRSILD